MAIMQRIPSPPAKQSDRAHSVTGPLVRRLVVTTERFSHAFLSNKKHFAILEKGNTAGFNTITTNLGVFTDLELHHDYRLIKQLRDADHGVFILLISSIMTTTSKKCDQI